MGDDEAVEAAWKAAAEVLEDDRVDEDAVATLREADELLRDRADDDSRTRRAYVLRGTANCHRASDDGTAVESVALVLLDGEWPSEALAPRLDAAIVAVTTPSVATEHAIPIAERAIALGGRSDDDSCRAPVAWLLVWLADVVGYDSPQRRRALLLRVVAEFEDVDSSQDSAQDRLEDPYYEGIALAKQPGQSLAAEAALRRAIGAGRDSAWLRLAAVLAAQPGREDDEEQALRAAVAVETLERSTYASWHLASLLHHVRGDRDGARAAFGHATTATGQHALAALRQLAILAALDGDHRARRALLAEFVHRSLDEHDVELSSRAQRRMVATTRVLFTRPMFAADAWCWRRRRRRRQVRAAG